MCTKVYFAMEIVALEKWVLNLVSQSVQVDWLCIYQNWAGVWNMLVC